MKPLNKLIIAVLFLSGTKAFSAGKSVIGEQIGKILSSPSCQAFRSEIDELREHLEISCGDNLRELNACFQTHLLRKSERLHIKEDGRNYKKVSELLKTYSSYLDPVVPPSRKYGTVVLLGSTFTNNADRLANLLTLHNSGLSFDALLALGSDRPLDPKFESKETLTNFLLPPLLTTQRNADESLPKTEAEAWAYLFKHAALPPQWPKPLILNTLAPAGQARARTEDTIRDLLQKHASLLKNRPLLFISSQPFSLLQEEIIKSILKDQEFDMAADAHLIKRYGLDSSFSVQNMLDTIARHTYQVLANIEAGVVQECPHLRANK
ncbi:MAG: hypothetical protein HYW48_06725 [Deltaproteobacteria bacterium]|nr:hypothetical protein [Deltaproteobacteria bacterium]